MNVKLNNFMLSTRVEGPGLRACIWVQGCQLHCPGCAVPWTWSLEGGTKYEVQYLAEQILGVSNIEGITFSGGEPFLQAKELFTLGKFIKSKSDLSILTYTGYSLEYIVKSDIPEWNELLSITDILIDGPYCEDLKTEKPLIGSSNQKIHFLTDRYIHLKDKLLNEAKMIEFHIGPDSTVYVNGNVRFEDLKDLLDGLLLKKRI